VILNTISGIVILNFFISGSSLSFKITVNRGKVRLQYDEKIMKSLKEALKKELKGE